MSRVQADVLNLLRLSVGADVQLGGVHTVGGSVDEVADAVRSAAP